MEDPHADRPLPAYAEEVFEAVQPHIASTENGLPEDTARERLQEAGFDPATIERQSNICSSMATCLR